MPADPRTDLPVVKARRDAHVELDRSAHALDDPEDLPLLGLLGAGVDREAVGQPGLAGLPEERRLEHEGVVEIGARVLPESVAGGLDGAVPAAAAVEQSAEAAARIEPGQATPIDRAVARYERGGMAVADQGVVADRGIRVVAHVRGPTRSGRVSPGRDPGSESSRAGCNGKLGGA